MLSLLRRLNCLGGDIGAVEQHGHNRAGATAVHSSKGDSIRTAKDFATEVGNKDTTAAAAGAAGMDAASSSSGIPAAMYELSCSRHDMQSSDSPSTSYPTTSYGEEWDALGACMTTASEMEACVDAVLEGSIKSAQTLFARYDMDLDLRLRQQDYYDLSLELNLALPYTDYQRFIDATFSWADSDHDGLMSIEDYIPLYKSIAAVRRAFRRQDHHSNGQIDRYDFYQLLLELELDGGQQGLQAMADAAFSMADSNSRGIVNFSQVLVWFGGYLASNSCKASSQVSVRHQ